MSLTGKCPAFGPIYRPVPRGQGKAARIARGTSRLVCWTDESWGDYVYWYSHDKKTLKRVHTLIDNMLLSPFEGLGKPEPLKESLSGFWSRRIDDINRVVYVVDDKAITIISCRYHY